MKLYRFRSLGDCESLERVEVILRTGKFWCSRFWEMNDPMEGIYWSDPGNDPDHVRQIFQEKIKHLICSFSEKAALQNPLMWGYYANGFKGIAIEVDVDDNAPCVEEVKYMPDIPKLEVSSEDSARKILCRKLKQWEHEKERRFLTHKTDERFQTVGKITGVVIGRSYPKTFRNTNFDGRWENMQQYACRVERIIKIANDNGWAVCQAQMRNGEVKIELWDDQNTQEQWAGG